MLCDCHIVLQTIVYTVEVPKPNSSEIVPYSTTLVAKHQIVTAICFAYQQILGCSTWLLLSVCTVLTDCTAQTHPEVLIIPSIPKHTWNK